MNSRWKLALAILVLGCAAASAQVVFDENFDGGYTGAFGTGSYQGGSPSNASITVLSSGGNPNGCLQVQMTATTGSDYFVGQAQLDTVSGNTDTNPSNYTLSFDAYGSQAANIQFIIQTWPNNYFGGTGPVINAVINDQLTASNTWQTFKVNLGTVTSANASGATWQIEFQLNASQWGGAGKTDTMKIDNIILTHLGDALVIASSANPSTYGSSVNFIATIVTNGVTASNATGQVVFSDSFGPISTNTFSGGSAISASVSNLLMGRDAITGVYSGGNYPAGTNTFTQIVNPASSSGIAQSNLWLYTDNLVNGFQNWSWATVNLTNLANPTPHSPPYCISITDAGYQALYLEHTDFNTGPYASLSFWINGGTSGQQQVQVLGLLDGNAGPAYALSKLQANSWQQITVPLASLGVASQPNCAGFQIKGTSGGAQPTFYVDDVALVAAAPPAVVHLGVNAALAVGAVDARHFGLNTATWDGSLSSSTTLPLLEEIGCSALRWPGGSSSDLYNWTSDPNGNATFRNIATNLGAQVFTTVNYGSGTAAEAAAWVLNANKTNNCAFKYWEVGNECYGTWENDTHAIQHDPYTYATNAVAYIQQMKAAYPTVPIKVGVVVVPGENTYVNNSNHFAVNPRTHATNYGWTPVVLSQMASLGVLPDFLIYHFYYQYTQTNWQYYDASPDSDPLLLQVAGNPSPLNWSDWNSASTNLQQQISDYVGSAGSNIELCVTENNSDAGEMGRESTGVVNALYLADSTSQLMKTGFKSYIWWDLHNGASTDGDMDPTIYGWRSNGDYGVLNGNNVPYPTFYAEKLLQYFGRPGDSVLNCASDNLLLSAYAIHRANGTLTLLVINKDMTTSLTGQIALTNFVPSASATILSYGIPQDQAAETNGSAALQDLQTNTFLTASTNFTYAFPPLSLTLFTFSPGASTLAALGVQSSQVQLLLQGQPLTTYIIQCSTDLMTWVPASTNYLAGSSTNVSITVSNSATQEYFRAVWVP